MATFTRGQTFGATETVTNTKLHNLVDNASISGITNADIDANAAIEFSKLLASSISGALFTNLNLIPSAAGLIPFANIPVPFGSTYVSLVSIPNLSLIPLTLSSWVSGTSMFNLLSIASAAGPIRHHAIVQSLASGAIPAFNGVDRFVGAARAGVTVSSVKAISSVGGTGGTYDGDVSLAVDITAGATVFVIFTGIADKKSATAALQIRLKHGASTVIQQFTTMTTDEIPVTLMGVVTGLSGSTTFAVEQTVSSGTEWDTNNNTLVVIQFLG